MPDRKRGTTFQVKQPTQSWGRHVSQVRHLPLFKQQAQLAVARHPREQRFQAGQGLLDDRTPPVSGKMSPLCSVHPGA